MYLYKAKVAIRSPTSPKGN